MRMSNGNRCSDAAADSVKRHLPRLRALVLRSLRRSGPSTCDQVEVRTHLSHQTASARICELARAGQIVRTGHRRPTRSGRTAWVWRLP